MRLVTLAPEADPRPRRRRTRWWTAGSSVSLGHSRCTYEEALEAADAGATLVTHLFNGMGPLGHRAPGLPGAALDDDRLTPSLIADFVHVHPVVAPARRAAEATASSSRMRSPWASTYFGQQVVDRDGAALPADGTLAGSTLTMDRAVRNMAALVGLPRAHRHGDHHAGPRRSAWTATRRGGIGGRADLVALDRATLEVVGVWLAGEPAYARP